jgi:hypothetical protein
MVYHLSLEIFKTVGTKHSLQEHLIKKMPARIMYNGLFNYSADDTSKHHEHLRRQSESKT